MRPTLRPNRPLLLPAQCARPRPLRPHRAYPSINAAAIIAATPPRRSLTRTDLNALSLPPCASFSSMLSTSRASPAFISLLKTLNMIIFTHIWMCRWNPNAFAHDILVSVASPAPSPFCDECGCFSESRDFAFLPARAPSRTSSDKNASRRTERAAPPRRRVSNAVPHAHPAHTITHSPPPALALPATYVPYPPTVPVSCATLPRRSKLVPAVYPQRTTRAAKCMRNACVGAPSYLAPAHSSDSRAHRSSPAIAARPHIRTASPSPVLFSPPRATATLLSQSPSTPTRYTPTVQRHPPVAGRRLPFLGAHPAAADTGGHPSSQGADARTLEDATQLSHRTPRCPRDTNALHCTCALSRSAPQLGLPCADAHPHAGEKEWIWRDPSGGDIFVHSSLFPLFSFVSQSLMSYMFALKYECIAIG
ncbi:hypothetical protein B0H13DRAFT_2402898 [Mycena leptocephala]|nr:hypothetical protein B0H13DRAFT_2402898 [Mycena leptocephala]